MRYLVLSCSLSAHSRSSILAQIAHRHLVAKNLEVDFIDLRDFALPFCNAGDCYNHPDVRTLTPRIAAARGLIVATAIYNYDVNAAAKNLVELTGRAWEEKVIGFVCAAGGHGSYMSVMPFANSLMLDYRCVIIPRFVYAPPAKIDEKTFGDEVVNQRTEELAVELVRITDALFPK